MVGISAALPADCSCLRGVAEHSKLVHQLWSSPEVTKQISQLAGIPLKPICDYEKGICNIQVGTTSSQ